MCGGCCVETKGITVGEPLASATSYAVEHISRGTLRSKPTEVPLTVVFDIRNGQIVGIREYTVP